jgi:hypothetical protein
MGRERVHGSLHREKGYGRGYCRTVQKLLLMDLCVEVVGFVEYTLGWEKNCFWRSEISVNVGFI